MPSKAPSKKVSYLFGSYAFSVLVTKFREFCSCPVDDWFSIGRLVSSFHVSILHEWYMFTHILIIKTLWIRKICINSKSIIGSTQQVLFTITHLVGHIPLYKFEWQEMKAFYRMTSRRLFFHVLCIESLTKVNPHCVFAEFFSLKNTSSSKLRLLVLCAFSIILANHWLASTNGLFHNTHNHSVLILFQICHFCFKFVKMFFNLIFNHFCLNHDSILFKFGFQVIFSFDSSLLQFCFNHLASILVQFCLTFSQLSFSFLLLFLRILS